MARNFLSNVVLKAADVSHETKIKGVVLHRSVGFPEDIRVEPEVEGLVISDESPQMVVEVGVNRNDVGLELGLESDAAGLEIELGIFLQTKGDLVVGELGRGDGVELDVGGAEELSVELDAVVGGIVVVEQT